jgi:hypothetical protein
MKNQLKPLFTMLIIAAFTAILFGACRKENCPDCKDVTTETIAISDKIVGIIIEGPWEVSITQNDSDNSAGIEYCTNFKNKITARIQPNGYLYLKLSPFNWCGKWNNLVLRATVNAAALEKIDAGGAAVIRTYGHFPSFKNISLSGASTINGLSCEGASAKIDLSGASLVKDFALVCEGSSVTIDLSGASTLKDFTFTGISIDAELAGASDANIDNVNLEYCKVNCSGASDFSCKGYAAKTDFNGSGASYFKTLNLESENLDIDLSGASNAEVTVNNTIKGHLYGASILKYKKATDVSGVHVSGGSRIIRID